MVSNIQEGNKLIHIVWLLTGVTGFLSFGLALLLLDGVALFFLQQFLNFQFSNYKLVVHTWTRSHCCSWTVLHCCSCTVLHFLSSTVLHSSPHSGSRKHSSDTFVVSLTREQVFPFCLRGPASGWGTPHTRWEAARRRRKDWNNNTRNISAHLLGQTEGMYLLIKTVHSQSHASV